MGKMKIASASIQIKNFEKNKNIEQILKKVDNAKLNGAEYIFFGEAALNGFDGLTWNYEEDIKRNAVNKSDREIIILKDYCKRNKIGIGVGFYENDNGKIFSSYIIINNVGKTVQKYQRISPGWKEKKANKNFYLDGKELKFINLGSSKCLLSICGDLWTEDYIERIKKESFDIIIWPLYISYTENEWNSIEKYEYGRRIAKIGTRTILINSEDNEAIGSLVEYSCKGDIINEVNLSSNSIIYSYI